MVAKASRGPAGDQIGVAQADHEDLGIRDPGQALVQGPDGLVELLLPRLGDGQIDIAGRRIGDVLQDLEIDLLGLGVICPRARRPGPAGSA